MDRDNPAAAFPVPELPAGHDDHIADASFTTPPHSSPEFEGARPQGFPVQPVARASAGSGAGSEMSSMRT
jgi:hypothetical protein